MFFLPTAVNINGMKLNSVDHLGSVSFNTSIKQNRNVNAKKNQGFGQQMADCTLRFFTAASIIDNEAQDCLSQKTTY